MIHSAPRNRLNRLRKPHLVRLYELAGHVVDGDSLTKSQIIEAIVNSRDDATSVPPSSPPGKTDGASSESEDAHFAGDEETDFGPRRPNGSLRRRVTLHDVSKAPSRPVKHRSFSMGNILGLGEPPKAMAKRKASAHAEVANNGTTTRSACCLHSILCVLILPQTKSVRTFISQHLKR